MVVDPFVIIWGYQWVSFSPYVCQYVCLYIPVVEFMPFDPFERCPGWSGSQSNQDTFQDRCLHFSLLTSLGLRICLGGYI